MAKWESYLSDADIWAFIKSEMHQREQMIYALPYATMDRNRNVAPPAYDHTMGRFGEWIYHQRDCEKCSRTKFIPQDPTHDRSRCCHWGKVILGKWEKGI